MIGRVRRQNALWLFPSDAWCCDRTSSALTLCQRLGRGGVFACRDHADVASRDAPPKSHLGLNPSVERLHHMPIAPFLVIAVQHTQDIATRQFQHEW
jgi:hypothetical protein